MQVEITVGRSMFVPCRPVNHTQGSFGAIIYSFASPWSADHCVTAGRAGEHAERHIHVVAACGVLLDLHDTLDRLVAQAYGWPWPLDREEILERLVALHDERVEEEKRGHVRWLRPDYQIPRFGREVAPAPELALPRPAEEAQPGEAARPWPVRLIDQLAALQEVLAAGPLTAEEAAEHFAGASPEQVRERLQMLAGAGEVWVDGAGRYNRVEQPV